MARQDRDGAHGTPDENLTRKKSVLITGCSSGIGRATALAFLDEDWRVFATARNLEDVTDLAEAGCETLALDVTDPGQVASAVEYVVDESGAIDCVVNNAGYAQLGPLEDVSTAELERQFDTNVFGPQRLTRAALPHMRAQGTGRIINVSSIIGRVSIAGMGAYAGSKHALEAMSDALRTEVEPFDVDVVVVEPGAVETTFPDRVDEELPDERTPDYDDLYAIIEDTKLVGGSGPLALDPSEVAAAIVHAATCADPPARYPVGPVAQYGSYARFLPDQVRDALFGVVRKFV
nr:SDR family oxidoreductase [Halovivax gelatinilyticus]